MVFNFPKLIKYKHSLWKGSSVLLQRSHTSHLHCDFAYRYGSFAMCNVFFKICLNFKCSELTPNLGFGSFSWNMREFSRTGSEFLHGNSAGVDWPLPWSSARALPFTPAQHLILFTTRALHRLILLLATLGFESVAWNLNDVIIQTTHYLKA